MIEWPTLNGLCVLGIQRWTGSRAIPDPSPSLVRFPSLTKVVPDDASPSPHLHTILFPPRLDPSFLTIPHLTSPYYEYAYGYE